MEGGGREEGKGDVNRIKMRYVCASVPQRNVILVYCKHAPIKINIEKKILE